MVSYDIYIFIHIFWIPQANVREVYQSLVGRDDGREIQWDFSKRYVTLYAFISLIVNKLG